MSFSPSIRPVTPRRAVARSSHLRKVSNGSSSIATPTHIPSRASTPGAAPTIGTVNRDVVERRGALSVHDELQEKENVLINLDIFGDCLKPGDLVAVVPSRSESDVRDFQANTPPPRKDAESLGPPMQRERSSSKASDNTSESQYGPDHEKRYFVVVKDMTKEQKAKQPHTEISIAKHIADVFGFKNRSTVLLTTVENSRVSASHVEMSFKDEYLSRSDMWRLVVSELSNTTVYKGQKILFLGTIKVLVTSVYVDGHKVHSAFFSTDTKPIFRSESARLVIFIQMSKEMWDFDSEGSGEIMFNKVVNGVLPAMFKKWAEMKAKHLVSIIMFSRVEYETSEHAKFGEHVMDHSYHTGKQLYGTMKPYKDFYRVVVSDMASGEWTTILYSLKREFRFFRRDISMHRLNKAGTAPDPNAGEQSMGSVPGTLIEAEPSLAMSGNFLEAINLASTQFSHDHIDRDLCRTGISITVITPGVGNFQVDYELLKATTEALVGEGIGIDLICLPKMPLHSVPLFKYRNPHYAAFEEAVRMRTIASEENAPKQGGAVFGSYQSLNERLSPSKSPGNGVSLPRSTPSTIPTKGPSEWSFAVPHWIDGSFWTGASQDVGSRPGAVTGPQPDGRHQAARQPRGFEVRCKMYEMEISNIVGNGLAEISVPALQNDPAHPVALLKRGPLLASIEKDKSVETPKPYAALSEPVMGPSRSAFDKLLSQPERDFYNAIEEYQAAVVAHSSRPDANSVSSTLRKAKLEETKAARKALAEDAQIFGTSLEHAQGSNTASTLAAAMKARNPDTSAQDDTHTRKQRQGSVGSVATTKSAFMSPPAPHKASPRFSRHISLGFRGFAVGAPKAAVAALQIEHASAVKPAGSASDVTEDHQLCSTKIAGHLATSAATVKPEVRPSSSQSNGRSMRSDRGSERSGENQSTQTTAAAGPAADTNAISKPIPIIKSALQSLELNSTYKPRPVLEPSLSSFRGGGLPADAEETHSIGGAVTSDSQKIYKSKLLANSVPDVPISLSPITALSPWLSELNPSNPSVRDVNIANQYRRWQHVHPKSQRAKTMKWKSLCSPASVPLTTEYFPTRQQLSTEYEEKPYNISQNFDEDLQEVPTSRDEFLRELIALRLSQGFQIVVGPAVANAFGQANMKIANVFSTEFIAEDGASIFMSMGSVIHQLSCINETEVNVHTWVRKPAADFIQKRVYTPAIRTTLAGDYEPRNIPLVRFREEYNWNYVDAFVAGHEDEMKEHLRFWRARFVLIPVERPMQYHRPHFEDNEEEIRLEGIRKLTQLWQRNRYIPPSERKFAVSRKRKDPNPLDIVYQTQDPSVVVAMELETLPLLENDPSGRRGQLLSEAERFRKSSLCIAALADAIQAPVERGGVRMQNRRWHFRLHYNCFIGSDMTTWLLENFEDIETREEAVIFGNQLMRDEEAQKTKDKVPDAQKDAGKEKESTPLFVHVEKRHPFRDGQYFYQITGDHAKPRPDSRSGWFGSLRRDISVPSTPISERIEKDFPSRSASGYEEKSSESGTSTPIPGVVKRPRVALSKMMKYDVDHRKRSYRAERINLHYDRLHNPDNCYHIRIDWMNVTPKLIEDAIAIWATTAERYGLRLVETPINESCSISKLHPFRAPYIIKLAVLPPLGQPETAYYSATSFAPQPQSTRHYYHKAILKKFNFVLDMEAARNFPSDVDVQYSWGKPDYRYSQYIHRTGVVFAQITDDSDFLLLANRLFNSKASGLKDQEKFVKPDHMDRDRGSGRMASATGGGSTAYDLRTSGFPPDRTPISSPMLRAYKTEITASPKALQAQSFSPVSSDVLGSGAMKISCLCNYTTPESIKNSLEAFCNDASGLEAFYKEILEAKQTPLLQPRTRGEASGAGIADGNIPALGLPPAALMMRSSAGAGLTLSEVEASMGLGESLLREQSPGPRMGGHSFRLAGNGFMGGPVRRGSWHPSDFYAGSVGSGNGSAGRDSPKGSIADGKGGESGLGI